MEKCVFFWLNDSLYGGSFCIFCLLFEVHLVWSILPKGRKCCFVLKMVVLSVFLNKMGEPIHLEAGLKFFVGFFTELLQDFIFYSLFATRCFFKLLSYCFFLYSYILILFVHVFILKKICSFLLLSFYFLIYLHFSF